MGSCLTRGRLVGDVAMPGDTVRIRASAGEVAAHRVAYAADAGSVAVLLRGVGEAVPSRDGGVDGVEDAPWTPSLLVLGAAIHEAMVAEGAAFRVIAGTDIRFTVAGATAPVVPGEARAIIPVVGVAVLASPDPEWAPVPPHVIP